MDFEFRVIAESYQVGAVFHIEYNKEYYCGLPLVEVEHCGYLNRWSIRIWRFTWWIDLPRY